MLLRVRATADLQRDGGALRVRGTADLQKVSIQRLILISLESSTVTAFGLVKKECLKQHAWFCSTCWWGGVSNPTLLRLGGSAELQGTCFDTFFNLQVQCVPNPPHVQVKTTSETLPQRVGGSAELQGGWVAYPPAPASQKHYFFA